MDGTYGAWNRGCHMKVTIAVPVYNTQEYLAECIESCIGQTYADIEILLIDDGSTDQSGAVCDAYAKRDTRVRVLHKENGGVSSARNLAIDQARGEYLLFVDSDDCIHREMVDIYMHALQSSRINLCSITEKKEDLSGSYGENWSEHLKKYDREHFMSFYYEDYVNSPCNKLYDMQVLKENHIKFDETLSLGEDMMFNLEYFQYAPLEYTVIDVPLYYYRHNREGSLVNSYRSDLFELQLNMFHALKKFLQKNNSWSMEEQQKYYGLLWDRLYMTACKYKRYGADSQNRKMFKDILKHPVWEEAERYCRQNGIMNRKRMLKKIHMELLKRW